MRIPSSVRARSDDSAGNEPLEHRAHAKHCKNKSTGIPMIANSPRQTRREFERVLAGVFGLLIQCGVSQPAISALINRAFRSAIARAQALGEPNCGELVTFSLVLDAWHRHRRYLTSRGRPRAVPLFGRAPSVEALIRTEGPQFDAAELAHRLQSLQLITRCSGNRYRPTSDTALVSTHGPTVLQYVANCLLSLLETVEGNLRGAPNVPPLLERFAEVPDLPAECIQPFQQFSRFQGAIFLRTINDWLEVRRARVSVATGQRNVRAGVRVHAYIVQPKPRSRRSTSSKRSTA